MFFMRLSLRLGVLALLCAGAAHAQTAPRSYAVLSEMAREINLVAFQESIGSRLNNNHRERIEVRDGVLDKFVLTTARARLAGLAPGAGLWLIAPLDTELFPGLQNPAVGSTLKIPEDLMQAMKEQKSTHLLLFTRHRDEADFELSKGGHAGSGAIEGVGFYVDRQFMIEDQVTRTTAAGFLAAFTYFRATLADAATGKVLRSKSVRAYDLQPTSRAKDSPNPWDAMTAAQKIETLRRLLDENIKGLLPELLAAP